MKKDRIKITVAMISKDNTRNKAYNIIVIPIKSKTRKSKKAFQDYPK